jgi:tetratricopeptide (TPR) repeat protein
LAVAGYTAHRNSRSRVGRAAVVVFLSGVASVVVAISVFEGIRARADRVVLSESVRVPKRLMATVAGKENLFVNPSGLAAMMLHSPGDLRGSQTLGERALWSRDPRAWRAADRRERWGAVVLMGPTTEFRPLLEHLLAAPDWHLAHLDQHGFAFLRGKGNAFRPPDPASITIADPVERAIVLAQLAERLEAVTEPVAARRALEAALKLAPQHPDVLVHAASHAAARRQWTEALKLAGRARAARGDMPYADLIEAVALEELGRHDEAIGRLQTLLRNHPDDEYTLFLAARIHRSRRDPTQEAEVLEKLVATAEARGTPVGNYLVFLGSAYAKIGDAARATSAFERALADPRLDPAQAEAVRETLRGIRGGE